MSQDTGGRPAGEERRGRGGLVHHPRRRGPLRAAAAPRRRRELARRHGIAPQVRGRGTGARRIPRVTSLLEDLPLGSILACFNNDLFNFCYSFLDQCLLQLGWYHFSSCLRLLLFSSYDTTVFQQSRTGLESRYRYLLSSFQEASFCLFLCPFHTSHNGPIRLGLLGLPSTHSLLLLWVTSGVMQSVGAAQRINTVTMNANSEESIDGYS